MHEEVDKVMAEESWCDSTSVAVIVLLTEADGKTSEQQGSLEWSWGP